jgi:3,4-dihydroxy 2-butanone 4-phosphate synthase/GTP cyclohydrolase II
MRWLSELERLKDAGAAHGPLPRPFVTAAFAISRDGCLTRTRGRATRISGTESMRITHELRARHDALLVGVGTVLSDDPALTTRLVEGPSPLRVVLDSRLRVPVTARLLHSTSRAAWLVTSASVSGAKARALAEAGADLVRVPSAERGVSLPDSLALLAAGGVRSLMIEGGAEVLESFFLAGAVDYLALTVSPRRLWNPRAVRIGHCTGSVLERWRAHSEDTPLGTDRLETGPLQPSAAESSWADAVLTAP